MNILPSKSVSINALLERLEFHKYNPSSMQNVVFDYLEEVTNGEVDIVDPTNPFVFLIESSVVNTSLAITENFINLRKQYPSLSQTEEEVYHHLSDIDFLNRFAVPSETIFTITIQADSLFNNYVYDQIEKCWKAKLPRDSYIVVDGLRFTLQYPIIIRRYENGVLQISYDGELQSPLESLKNNIITYIVRQDNDGVNWIVFDVLIKQFSISDTYFPIQQSTIFNYDITFEDYFYYARVYFRSANTLSLWKEITTTHTDQVFDHRTPTAVLKVTDNNLNVFIPTVYLTNSLVDGEIRIDVYTTKGNITVNLKDYKPQAFTTTITAINEERDIDEYSNALLVTSFFVFSNKVISGGSNGITFNKLRERTIFNSIGDRQLPVTNIQISAFVENRGFDLIENIDVVTNRIFLATRRLPKPLNKKLLTYANIGITPFVTSIESIRSNFNVIDNRDRVTILSNSLFINNNGIIHLLEKSELDYLNSLPKSDLVSKINSSQYLYMPFHAVLDPTQTEFKIRVYNLDLPEASNLSFKSQNYSIQLPVNTNTYILEKTFYGYSLTVTTKSGNFYKETPNNLVTCQIGFYPDGENNLAYINGTLIGNTEDNERVYLFKIETNHDLNDLDQLCITNAKMFDNSFIKTWINLEQLFYIFYNTSSITVGFIPSIIDNLIGKEFLPINSVNVTMETLKIKTGSSLKNLWSRSRSFVAQSEYQVYEEDIPLFYDKDIYQTDPITGSIITLNQDGTITYNIKHRLGDQVVGSDGLPVFIHKKGEVKLDQYGYPYAIDPVTSMRDLDLLFIDGRYFFATDNLIKVYRKEIASIIDTWVTLDLEEIQKILLEQTRIYFYPKTTLTSVKVLANEAIDTFIPAEQEFEVNLYVRNKVFIDPDLRKELTENTIKILDEAINVDVVNISDISQKLSTLYRDSVISFTVNGLGDSRNFATVSLFSRHNRLCLKKKAELQQDGVIIITESSVVNFFNTEPNINN